MIPRWLLYLILLILALISAGLGFFYVFKPWWESQKEQDQGDQTPPPPPSPTESWETYTNEKHGFSFKYPPDYIYGPCTTKPCANFVYDKQPGYVDFDYVVLQGDISTEGWPNLSVTADFAVVGAGTELLTWVKENSPNKSYAPDSVNFEIGGLAAVKIEVPQSPQAYSSWEIYILKETVADSLIYQFLALDVAAEEARDFYELILSTFTFD